MHNNVHHPRPLLERQVFKTGKPSNANRCPVQKAAARACRNAIEFNSLPAIKQLVPNGYDGLLLHVKIGVPKPVSKGCKDPAISDLLCSDEWAEGGDPDQPPGIGVLRGLGLETLACTVLQGIIAKAMVIGLDA